MVELRRRRVGLRCSLISRRRDLPSDFGWSGRDSKPPVEPLGDDLHRDGRFEDETGLRAFAPANAGAELGKVRKSDDRRRSHYGTIAQVRRGAARYHLALVNTWNSCNFYLRDVRPFGRWGEFECKQEAADWHSSAVWPWRRAHRDRASSRRLWRLRQRARRNSTRLTRLATISSSRGSLI